MVSATYRLKPVEARFPTYRSVFNGKDFHGRESSLLGALSAPYGSRSGLETIICLI